MYKCVNDVAGYHCQACNCVKSNKGLQKPLIFKKKKKKNVDMFKQCCQPHSGKIFATG